MVRRGRGGYSLAEMLIAAALAGLLIAILPRVLLNFVRFYRVSIARGEVQRDARIAMENIVRNLRQATAASVVVTRQHAGQPFFSKITFTTIDGSSVAYWQEGNYLWTSVGGGQAKALTSNLRFLTFTYPETAIDDLIAVGLTMEKTGDRGQTFALEMVMEPVKLNN